MTTILEVKVVPNASRDEISGWLGDNLKLRVRAPPERGRANRAVIKLLSDELGIPARDITVIDGQTSPLKKIRFEGITGTRLRNMLPPSG
ncbi:MAG: DUF167 domain-containing protein [Proteobacteria bacterium]|nr:DUF167 domain-containing protein [Pseudomonadota bacterium]